MVKDGEHVYVVTNLLEESTGTVAGCTSISEPPPSFTQSLLGFCLRRRGVAMSAGTGDVSARDDAVVAAQIGRGPRGPWRVATRCPYGHPSSSRSRAASG